MIDRYKFQNAFDTFGIKGSFLLGMDYLRTLALGDKVKVSPRSIQIEPNNTCNLRCEMCDIYALAKKEICNLNFENFKKIISNFNYWHSLRLWGVGEPFLNKDIFKIIKYESDKGNYVNLSTNANLLDKDTIQKIIDSGLKKLIISIDGGTKKLYEKIRRGAKWEKLMESLQLIKEMITDKRKKPVVRITTIIMRQTIHELKNIITLAHKYNINTVLVQELQTGHPGIHISKKESVAAEKKALQALKQMVIEGKKKNVNVIIPDLKVRTKRERCVSPWLQVYITCNGDVTPCCRNISKSHYICGNILEEPFKNIWNNKKYQNYRKALREGNLPSICKNCNML